MVRVLDPDHDLDVMLAGRAVLLIATLVLLHAAYSAYEHLSVLKAAGKPEHALPLDIIVETLVALVLGTVGASLDAPPLREITWASELRTRSMEEMNGRLGFADWGTNTKNPKITSS